MAFISDASVGDLEIPYLDVTPADDTTAGTITVTGPGDTDVSPAATTAGEPITDPATDVTTVRLTAGAVTYDRPGRWVLHWDVTGVGAGDEDFIVYITTAPTAGGPTWLPGRSRVANYVPGRTLPRNVETHELTFTSRTMPTGFQVDRLIADAAAWITVRTGAIHATLVEQASVCAAIWAAAAVERGYPAEDDEQSLTRAKDLQALADRMRDDLIRANDAATGGDNPTNPDAALMPVWSFPPPVPWGDSLDL